MVGKGSIKGVKSMLGNAKGREEMSADEVDEEKCKKESEKLQGQRRRVLR